MTKNFATVWDAIEDTPDAAAAMRMRADLMMSIGGMVRGWGKPQREAARRLGITQPRLNETCSTARSASSRWITW
jgi:predicted XRE-type DNA-binding protein